jgi:hypothetical protein
MLAGYEEAEQLREHLPADIILTTREHYDDPRIRNYAPIRPDIMVGRHDFFFMHTTHPL